MRNGRERSQPLIDPTPTQVVSRQTEEEEAESPSSIADKIQLGHRAIPLSPDLGASKTETPRTWMGSAWATDPDPAMTAFSSWAMGYIEQDAASRISLEAEGVQLAAARLANLKEMMSTDPHRALANAVPEHLLSYLPASVSALLEEKIHAFGDLVTEYRCDERAQTRTLATIGGKTYLSRLYGSRRHLDSFLGTSIHGIAVGEEIAVLDGPIYQISNGTDKAGIRFMVGDQEHAASDEPALTKMEIALAAMDGGETPLDKALASKGLDATYGDFIYAMGDSGLSATVGYPQRRSPSHTHGGKRILILRLRANDDTYPANATNEFFQNWSFAADGWDQRLRLTSYQKTWLSGVDVTPVLVMPNPASYYVHPNPSNASETVYESGRWADDGEAAARAAGYNPDNYFCVVVGTREFANGGIGWAAGKRIWVNGAYGNFAALMHHEFGHILGLPHASSWSSTDGNPISVRRVNQEYGDENDPMGNGGKTFRNTYQAYFKNLSGWMPDSCVQTVLESGTYTVYQDDGETSLDRTLALKLGRDHEIMYWISIRGDLVQTNHIENQSNFLNGVSIVAVTPWANPHTLDINNPNDGNRRNSPLAFGATWYDANADISFKTVEVGGTNPNRYAKVQITFGPLHRGGYRPLVSGGVYRFRNLRNNQYLTVPGNSTGNVNVEVAALNTTDNSQSWVAWRDAAGAYRFNHLGTTKWLEVRSNSPDTGARIRQNSSVTSDNSQNWHIFQTETDAVFVLHKGTEGRLMEMDVNNLRVHQMNSTGTTWQQWYPELVAITPGTYRVLPRLAETQALGIANAALGDGPETSRAKWGGYIDQQWSVSGLDSGRIRLTPAHSPTRALDVNNSGSAAGTRLQQWTWNESAAQRWQYTRVEGQWLRFTPDCAPLASMEARGVTTGSSVQLGIFSGAPSQQWRFADLDPLVIESPFQLWGRRLQLSGANAFPASDQDKDGTVNLMEFALNGNPLSAISRGGYNLLPDPGGSGPVLIAAVRTGASFVSGTGPAVASVDGIRYTVQASRDLIDWTSLQVEVLAAVPPHDGAPLAEGWEYRAFRLPVSVEENVAFLRIMVSDAS